MTGFQRARGRVPKSSRAASDEKRRRKRAQRRRDAEYLHRRQWDAEPAPVERLEPWNVD